MNRRQVLQVVKEFKTLLRRQKKRIPILFCAGLNELLALDPDNPAFELSRRAIYHAQLASSFELPGFERTYASADLQEALADAALKDLKERFPAFTATK